MIYKTSMIVKIDNEMKQTKDFDKIKFLISQKNIFLNEIKTYTLLKSWIIITTTATNSSLPRSIKKESKNFNVEVNCPVNTLNGPYSVTITPPFEIIAVMIDIEFLMSKL